MVGGSVMGVECRWVSVTPAREEGVCRNRGPSHRSAHDAGRQ